MNALYMLCNVMYKGRDIRVYIINVGNDNKPQITQIARDKRGKGY